MGSVQEQVLLVSAQACQADALRNRFRIVLEANRDEVLATVKSHDFDVVVADESIIGADVARLLHQEAPDIPVIMILERADNRLTLEAIEAGATLCLVKPIEERTLERALIHVIRQQRVAKKSLPSGGALDVFFGLGVLGIGYLAGRLKNPGTTKEPPQARAINTLVTEFDELYARMQTPEARTGMGRAFEASSAELGAAAVKAAGTGE